MSHDKSALRIDEKTLVQYPMIRHAAEIGWEPVEPGVAKELRGSVESMVFRPVLLRKLAEFNPWLSETDLRAVVDSIEALPASIDGNRDALSWLRGERSWFDAAEGRHRPVRLVDFESAGRNALQCSWEWYLKPPARKPNRADLLFLVNGLPVCIVEHKNPKRGDAIERAIVQIRRYELETPELLGTAQLFNVTHLLDYWYGITWNATKRDMTRWKQAPEETYRYAVQSFFEPTDFLRTLERWILFYVQDGETRKSVLRQHQRRAIDAVVARCADPDKRRGLIWHTQGSGKTFTLLSAARLILEDRARFAAATVILVIDRSELEGQLKGWVERLLGELQKQDIATRRAYSKKDLQALLDADFRGLVISMIHKFEGSAKDSLRRDNVYVFVDEAHRSVAKDLGTYLMAAVPNATIIGFTGTPVANSAQGEGTFKIFGGGDPRGYLDKYSILDSIGDGTTLPIKHAMAPSEMSVPVEELDREFFALAESEDVTDIEELNRVLNRSVALRTFLSADDRVEKVASFVAAHFRDTVLPLGYKAFLVAVNREACAKYKIALDRHLPAEWTAAVYSENPQDALSRPLVARLQLGPEEEESVRTSFKKPAEDPKILIVTDKLLAGYDAPPLYCMYLDKPMRDHVLLQAIARVNRPYVDAAGQEKRVGLVVDFVGVLRELKKALRFDSDEVDGLIQDIGLLQAEFERRMRVAREEWLRILDGSDGASYLSPEERLESLVFRRFLDAESRKSFFEAYKDLENLWEILSPSASLRDYIEDYKALAGLYAATRNAYADHAAFLGDLARKTRRLIESSAVQTGLERLTRSVTFDTKTLAALRAEPGADEGKIFNLVRGLREEVERDAAAAPVLLPLRDRADRILHDLIDRRTTSIEALEALAALARERELALQSARESGLSSRAFSAYWSVREDRTLYAAGISALDLAKEAEAALGRYPNAADNPEEARRLRTSLYVPLSALAADEKKRLVDILMSRLLGELDS